MATDKQTLIDDVIELTSPKPELVSTTEVDSLMTVAEREITTRVGTDVEFHGPSGSDNAQQASYWLTCLFVKVKTGEIEAARTQIGDLQMHPLSGNESMWMENFEYYLGELTEEVDSTLGFEHRKIRRRNRTYGDRF